jgi:hypothetical protein
MTARRWIQAGVLALAAVFVLWAAYFIFRTSFVAIDGQRYFSLFDDAMISMRYAWNFSHGAGLVWNPGERVEGYTNLLMVGLMSVWTSLFDKSSAVLAVQLTGIPILLGIAALGLLHRIELGRGNDVLHRKGFPALVFMGSLLYYPLAYWTLMGMETGLLTLLLLTGSLLSLVHIRTGAYPALVAAAAAQGLAYLARPDSAPVAALLLGAAALFAKGTLKRRLSAVAIGAAIYLLFPILQASFRATYYGSLVPVTYTLKMTRMPFDVRLKNGRVFAHGQERRVVIVGNLVRRREGDERIRGNDPQVELGFERLDLIPVDRMRRPTLGRAEEEVVQVLPLKSDGAPTATTRPAGVGPGQSQKSFG